MAAKTGKERWQFFRFTASSASSAVVDLGLFWLFRMVLPLPDPYLIPVSTVIARCASSLLNFSINRRWSFSATDARTFGRTSVQAGRYAILFVAKMAASALIVQLLAKLPLQLEITKALVDIALFGLSYVIERDWVYKRR